MPARRRRSAAALGALLCAALPLEGQVSPSEIRIYSAVSTFRPDSVNDLLRRGHYQLALEVAQRWSLETPGNTEALSAVALSALLARQPETARQAADQAVLLAPDVSVHHLLLGRAYFDLGTAGDTPATRTAARQARQEFERAVQLDSTNLEAYEYLFTFHLVAPAATGASRSTARRLAARMYRLDPVKGTWAQLRTAATLGPDSAIRSAVTRAIPLAGSAADSSGLVMATLATTAASATGATTRENLVALLYQRFPADPRVRFQRARLWVMQEEHLAEAEQMLQGYLGSVLPSRSPGPSVAQWYLARALEKQGKHSEAIAAYEAGSRMNPPCAQCSRDAQRLRQQGR